MVNSRTSPLFNSNGACRAPVRMAGPCVSSRIPTGRRSSSASRRTRGTISRTHSGAAWLMLKRKTSAPFAMSCRSMSLFSVAGPSVQMIFVLRIRTGIQRALKQKAARQYRRAASREQTVTLLQFALGLFCQSEMFLDHFRCPFREFLQIRIISVAGFVLELGQIFLVVFHHHAHIILV